MFRYKKSKSKILSTYSKRKQIVRIVRDQWRDVQNSRNEDSFDNVFDLPQPNTSTPLHAPCTIPESSPVKNDDDHLSSQVDLKPIAISLHLSGMFDDSPEIIKTSAAHRRMNRTKSRNASQLSITKDLSHHSHKSSTYEPFKELAIVPEVNMITKSSVTDRPITRSQSYSMSSISISSDSSSNICSSISSNVSSNYSSDVSKNSNHSSSGLSSNKIKSQTSNTSNCFVIQEVDKCNAMEVSDVNADKENMHDNSASLFSIISDGSEDKSGHSITSVVGSCGKVSMSSVSDYQSAKNLEIAANILSKSSIMEMSLHLDKSKKVRIALDKSENKSGHSITSVVGSKNLDIAANVLSKSSIMEISLNLDKSKNVSRALDKSEELEQSMNRNILLDRTTPSLLKLKGQCKVIPCYFEDLLSKNRNHFIKIGEGCFGEVYMDQDTVYKVVPVGGTVDINGAEQTSYENALQEILVSKMLSDLAGDEIQMGKAFCQLKDVVLTSGLYPQFLLEIWDKFDANKTSENERPDVFPSTQRYVVLLSRYSGVQLEDYCTNNNVTPNQAHSILRQCCCSLAAAEKQYKFEHRDLHWGNVLIDTSTTELVEFTADGKEYILRSHGLLATIIDFTFSRLETNGCLNFVDLENEEWLFQGDQKVDIQFRVYRDMRRACRKNWSKFTPKTNVHWLTYLIEKMNFKIKSKKLKNLQALLANKKSASDALPYVMRSL